MRSRTRLTVRSRGGAVAGSYHTGRFTKVPRLSKLLRVPTAADRGPGRPWRPGTPPPPPIDPDTPGADIRIGYARQTGMRRVRSIDVDCTPDGLPPTPAGVREAVSHVIDL